MRLVYFVFLLICTCVPLDVVAGDWLSEGQNFERQNFVSEPLYSSDFSLEQTPAIYRDTEQTYLSYAGPVIRTTVSGQSIVIGSIDGTLRCFNQAGNLLWSYQTKGSIYGTATIGQVNGVQAVAVGSTDGFVYLLALADGQLIWSKKLGGPINTSPLLTATGLIVTSNDGKITKLAIGDGSQIWATDIGGYQWASPALSSDGMRVVTAGVNGRVSCLDESTGAITWQQQLVGALRSTPALHQDRIYLAAGEKLLALSLITGDTQWIFADGASTLRFTAPGVSVEGSQAHLVFASVSGKLFKVLDAGSSASLIWQTAPGGDLYWPPTLSDSHGLIVRRSVGGTGMHAFSIQSGAALNDIALHGNHPAVSTAVLANEFAYVVSNNNLLHIMSRTTASFTNTPTVTVTSTVTPTPTATASPTSTQTPRPGPCISTAILANLGASTHNSGTLVDSYNSSIGQYGGNNIFSNGNVQAATEIIQNSGSQIHGTTLQNSPAGLVNFPLPSSYVNLGDLNIDGNYNFEPGDYLIENLNINGSGQIGTTAAGLVRIWFKNMNLAGTVTVGSDSQSARDLWFFGRNDSQQLNINGTATVYAVIYAPTIPVIVSGGHLYGAIVGSTVTLNSDAALHYDESLNNGCDGMDPLPSPTSTSFVTSTPTPSQTGVETPTESATPSHTETRTVTRTASETPTSTDTGTFTVTETPSASPTETPSATGTATLTVTPSQTGMPSATETATNSPTPSPSATATPSPSATPTHTPTPTQAVQVGDLNLEIWNAGISSNEVKVAARITNHGSAAIALNRLSVKVWIDDLGTGDIVPVAFGNNQTLWSSSGQWQANVDQPAWDLQSLGTTHDCGSSRRASHSLKVSFMDAGSKQLAASGGFVETNGGNSLITWHRGTSWPAMDSSFNYSKGSDAGTNSAGRINSPYFTLYLDGQLVVETLGSGQPDSQTGIEPCPGGGEGGSASLRNGPKAGGTALPEDPALQVAPNPAGSAAWAWVVLPKAGRAVLRVHDLTGRPVWDHDLGFIGAGRHRQPLPVASWAPGVYFVTLAFDEGLGLRDRALFKLAVAR